MLGWKLNPRSLFLLKMERSSCRKEREKVKRLSHRPCPPVSTLNQVCDHGVSLCPDSAGTKFGGKPGGKKPFKPYNNAERKSRPGKGRDGGKKETKFSFSKAGKRKLADVKSEDGEGEGEKRSAVPSNKHWSWLHIMSCIINTVSMDTFCTYTVQTSSKPNAMGSVLQSHCSSYTFSSKSLVWFRPSKANLPFCV